MTHAQKPDFVFRRNGRVHLNRRGASVQSTTGSRGERIRGSNAGYTMFRGSVKGTGYPLHSHSFPLHFPSRASPPAITFQMEPIFGKGRNCSTVWNIYTFHRPLLLPSIDPAPNYYYNWSTFLRNTQIKSHLSTAYVMKSNMNCQYGNWKQMGCTVMRSLYALRIHPR